MNALTKALAWPVVTLLVIGGSHLVVEALLPALHDVVTPAVVMPIYLAVGGWAAFAAVRGGGTFVHGLVGGALLGLLPLMLQLVGFGLLLGRGIDAVTTSATFGFIAMVWGGAIGSGIGSSIAARETGDAAQSVVGEVARQP